MDAKHGHSKKVLVKKLETSQRAMERKLLNVKLKDRTRNTIIKRRTRVTDVVQYVTNTKWKGAGHIARIKKKVIDGLLEEQSGRQKG